MKVTQEMHEQPEAVARLLDREWGTAERVAAILRRPDVNHVVVAGRGTSDNVARYAQYVWGGRSGLPVLLAAPSLFSAYDRKVDLKSAAVVVVSQSGQSPDLLAVADHAHREGRPVIAVTNDTNSPITEHAREVIDLRAGPEKAVAATKTYTASLTAIAMISCALQGEPPKSLSELPADLIAALHLRGIDDATAAVSTRDRCMVLGRGWNLATAHEWALKLQELAGVVAQPWSPADFEHGPIAAVTEAVPVLAASVLDPSHRDTTRILERLARDRHAASVLITNGPTARITPCTIRLPGRQPAWLTPIVAAPILQRFAIAAAVAQGNDPDRPRGLQKVTRTR